MYVAEKLMGILAEARIHETFKIISDFSSSFTNILLLIIYVIAVIGFYFWYIHKKYRSRYISEKSTSPEFLSDLINESIEGLGESKNFVLILTKSVFSVTIIILAPIAYYFLGIKGVYLIIFLDLVLLLKLNTKLDEITIIEGMKNNHYISPYIRISSLEKSLKWLFDSIFFKKIIYILIFIGITFIILFSSDLFYIWFSFWMIFYVAKLIPLSYKLKLMANLPKLVNVEYITGDKENNLILHQTTSLDYRFKRDDTEEELIIPATSIKKIHFGYDFELSQLDKLISIEKLELDIPSLHKYNNYTTVTKIFDIYKPFFIFSRAKSWYRKSVIYTKIRDFENAKKCLEEAINLDRNFKDIAKYDKSLDNIRNESWFIELMDT